MIPEKSYVKEFGDVGRRRVEVCLNWTEVTPT